MEKSALYQFIRTLSPVEIRDVRRFLQSPFYNQRADLCALFDILAAAQQAPAKETVWLKLQPAAHYEEQKMRLLMSYLNRLLEQYLAVKEMSADPLRNQLSTAIAFRKRGLQEHFERQRREMDKSLQSQPLRHSEFHQLQFQLYWETHQQVYAQDPTAISMLRHASATADTWYYSWKLRLICLLTAHNIVYPADWQPDWDEELIARAEIKAKAETLPSLRLYLLCYQMLRFPAEEAHFHNFKTALAEDAPCFPPDEMHSLYILAINYCIRKLNAGDAEYFAAALDLYKAALAQDYLLENGVLSRFTYHNVVAAGLHVGELDWVRNFINEYGRRLEKKYRESSFSFNLARLEYASKRYDYVLELLQQANYRDPLLNLAAKTLLLKTYYEIGAHDSLQSHLDAMRNYIRRKRVLGYHRTNYLTIIRYAEKLMRLNPNDKKAVQAFVETLEKEPVLTEKSFFLKAAHVLY
jgi:hypothetical protein